MRYLSDKFLGSVFCGWLCLFWLSFLTGAPVPPVVGNRALAAGPAKTDVVLSSSWMQKWCAWSIDHSPFRLRILVERNRIVMNTAKAVQPVPMCPGNAEIAMGSDGWLFLMEDVPDSRSPHDVDVMVKRAQKIARAVIASGRRFYLMPIPDKSSVYPDKIGVLMRWADDRRLREQSWTAMEAGFSAPEFKACYLPLWNAFTEVKKHAKGPLYWGADTHWNSDGMVVPLPLLLDRVQPGVWKAQAILPDGTEEHGGDLAQSYLIQSVVSVGPKYKIARQAPSLVEDLRLPNNGGAHLARYHSTDPLCVKGRTLVITDSFLEGALALYAPWFEDVTFVHFNATGSPELAERISHCDTLIFTSVERFMRWRMGVWSGKRFEYLSKALAKRPGGVGDL